MGFPVSICASCNIKGTRGLQIRFRSTKGQSLGVENRTGLFYDRPTLRQRDINKILKL